MQSSPNIPPIIALPPDTTVSDALLHDIRDVLKENTVYQLAALEQQNQLHDSLNELNRSILVNREERHTEVRELSLQVNGLREDLNRRSMSFSSQIPKLGFKATTGMGRRSSRRHRRAQTPRPTRRSPDLADSSSEGDDLLDADDDPNHYRHSQPAAPFPRSYTPAPVHPRMPSVTMGSPPARTSSNRPRPGSRQRSSQESSGLTYISDNPVIPPPPPGFVPYPGQDQVQRQNPFPTPRVPFQQSPLHPTPMPPPPQMHLHRHRASSDSHSD